MQNQTKLIQLAIVVPCYNEEEVLPHTSTKLLELLNRLIHCKKVNVNSKIYFVDDGSQDKSWEIIHSLVSSHESISGIKLSRNHGHQNALLAGLFSAEGDAIISIDSDLQDDVNAIEAMIDEFYKGVDIVYGVRRKRDKDTTFKYLTAKFFYKLMILLGVELIDGHADFRLMSRRTVEHFKEFDESNLFLRAMIPQLGYQTSIVLYDRLERFAGESKYPIGKMLSFALDGITSFSVKPLRIITLFGFLVFFGSIITSAWVLGVKIITDTAVPGWASTVLPIYFIGGTQIFCIGVLGEYIGKIYLETKKRPRYIIEKIIT